MVMKKTVFPIGVEVTNILDGQENCTDAIGIKLHLWFAPFLMYSAVAAACTARIRGEDRKVNIAGQKAG